MFHILNGGGILLLNNLLVKLHVLPSFAEITDTSVYLKTIFDILFQMKSVGMLLGGYWFLAALFFGSLIFFAVRKICSNLYIGCGILLITAILLNLFQYDIHVWNFNWIHFFAAFFIMTGHLYRQKIIDIEKNQKAMLLFLLIPLIISFFFSTRMTDCPSWGIPIYAMCAIMGTLVIFGVSHKISKHENPVTKFLIYTGGYTFNVLTWHFLSFKVVSFYLILMYNLEIDRLSDLPFIEEYAKQGYWFVYLLVGCIVPIVGTYLYHSSIDFIKRKSLIGNR